MSKLWIRCMSLIAVMSLAGLAVAPGFATTMAPQNLAALAKSAQDIVVGDVTRITEGRQGNLSYQEVEVSVSEAILGTPGRTLKFRQFGVQAKQPVENGRRFIGQLPSMPQYTVGENVILFLGDVVVGLPDHHRPAAGQVHGALRQRRQFIPEQRTV